MVPFMFVMLDTNIERLRPYRKALAFDAASAEIARQAGPQFDAVAVEAFLGAQATLRDMAQPTFITTKRSTP